MKYLVAFLIVSVITLFSIVICLYHRLAVLHSSVAAILLLITDLTDALSDCKTELTDMFAAADGIRKALDDAADNLNSNEKGPE